MGELRGRFISLEGGEGVGKSSNIAFIVDWLTDAGIPFIQTREPGGTPLAEEVRELLLRPRDEGMTELSELLLVFAARAQHLHTKIEPALAAGTWVLCDRFTDATFAYQGYGRGLSRDTIEQLQQMVQGARRPDLTLLLDAPVEVGMARAGERGELDRFEQEQHSFFERVRAGYLALAEADPQRFSIIDASQPLADVQRDIGQVLQRFVDGSGASA
ncbi:dTMP kinase [Spongiibacter sp. KMU-166]|uniref:Thymidylate kinase n=2 Tax=Spongiibacter thalassae TaxID=2721624 RepID=A0ABX1GEE3_9GAMM|nr:dTMP kinase [Spongiibacter thalassae]